jgi:hypothetical protein
MKLCTSKVVGVPTVQILGLPGQKNHLDVAPMERHKIYYKGGRWWLPPSLGRGEFCESEVACGSSYHQECSNYALTTLC